MLKTKDILTPINASHPTHQLGPQPPLATIQSGRTVNRQYLTIAPARPLRVRPASESGGKYVWSFALPSRRAGFATCSRRLNAFKKCSQFGRRPELRNSFQFLECRGERVR